MSERIVNDPSLHGWVEENGKWVWEGGATTGHIEDGTVQGQITTWDVAKTEWTPEGTITANDGGKALTINNSGSARIRINDTSGTGTSLVEFGDPARHGFVGISAGKVQLLGDTGYGVSISTDATERLTIDATGNATFSKDIKIRQDSAIGLDLLGTVSAIPAAQNHGYVATADASAGGANGDLLIAPRTTAATGIRFITGTTPTERLTIDSSGDAQFSGTVDAAGFTVGGVPIGGGGADIGSFTFSANAMWSNSGLKFQGTNIIPLNNAGANTSAAIDLGAGSVRFKDAYFSGNVNATDVIASSDERLKDNITTAPVGLIDSLKGREWDWKESGEKGSGVVAQELEQVLPHLVHTDDEGMKSVSYMGLCAYLIEEVKALKAEVEALKS